MTKPSAIKIQKEAQNHLSIRNLDLRLSKKMNLTNMLQSKNEKNRGLRQWMIQKRYNQDCLTRVDLKEEMKILIKLFNKLSIQLKRMTTKLKPKKLRGPIYKQVKCKAP